MTRQPPYTTRSGLRIGSAYAPTTRPNLDRDALRIQRALLGERPAIDASGIFIAAVVSVVIAIVLITHWIS
jgi:hypothetical protein